ncbi:MAG: DUF885 family protein [Alteromonadaceae bacterium]|nr:DUF885 family protein [Alteromonadaceae bacterium]
MLNKSLASIALSTLLIACGGGGGSSNSNVTPAPTTPSTPAPAPTTPVLSMADQDVVSAFADDLSTMDLQDIIDDAVIKIELRDPENLVALTLDDDYGLTTVGLTDISYSYELTTLAMWQAVYDRLQQLDTSEYTQSQQLNFDVLSWLALEQAERTDFIYFDYQATYFLTSVPRQTQRFFSDLHPLETAQDAQNYLARLNLVSAKIGQLIANLQEAESQGIIEPQITMQFSIDFHQRILTDGIQSNPYFSRFNEQIDSISDLTNEQKAAHRQTAQDIVEQKINPAYQQLINLLNDQITRAPAQIGVGQFERGDEYYMQRLGFHTTTDMTPQQIHDLGLQEVARIQEELNEKFASLGYPQNETLEQHFNRVASDSGFVPAAEVVPTYEALIEDAESRMSDLFSRFPVAEVAVIGGEFGGFYIRAALDGSRPGAFYASNISDEPYFTMPTLAYHEAMPGHHMQIALAQETQLPDFRRNLSATGYIEGWGLYAEYLAGEYGWYENDIYGDIGRLNFEILRAARLVVDTGIHAFGWSFQEASEYFQQNVGVSIGSAQSNIARYSIYTGQATAYMIGMLKLIELRELMRDAQGAEFDIKRFHDLVLDNGAMPLSLLETNVQLAIGSD